MSSQVELPPPLPSFNAEQFRQRLALLIDPREQLQTLDREDIRDYAVNFVAALPMVFGESLDRTTLWDKIGTALEVGYAKTAGDDTDFFISRVLENLKASSADVARNEKLCNIIEWTASCTPEMRHAWLAYMSTHRYAVLVRGRAQWEQYKEDSKHG